MRALRFLLRKEFLQIFRDHVILGMLFVMPLAQLLILANAATFEVKRARLYLVDHDHSTISRGVVDRLTASRRFELSDASPSVARADEAMLAGKTDIILVIPRDFERDIVRAGHASLQFIVNAEDGAAAGVMQAYGGQILTAYSRELTTRPPAAVATIAMDGEPAPRAGRPLIEVRRRGWYNADLQYRDYMVPGILVVLVTMIGTLLTAMNIVREKEAGTLDQLNVTPIPRATFIAAKLIPLWSLALADLALGLTLARLAFDVPIRGSLLVIFLAAAIYLLAALGIGLWVSTIAETQQQAMFVTFSILMVYLLMSGLFTPVRGMPPWARMIAAASPIMHFVRLMRAVMLKGATLADVMPQLLTLALIGLVVLTLAVRQHRKRAA